MLVARWYVQARFGHKAQVIELLRQWDKEVGASLGLDPARQRLVTASVGASEAQIESEIQVESLAELDALFTRMGQLEFMATWSKKLEPFVVSGSSRWEVFRTL